MTHLFCELVPLPRRASKPSPPVVGGSANSGDDAGWSPDVPLSLGVGPRGATFEKLGMK